MAKFDFSYVKTRLFFGFCHRAADQKTQVPKLWTALHLILLYFLILLTYSEFARKNNFISLCVWFAQFCSSADRRFAASRSRVHYYRRIDSFLKKKSMKYVVNWIPLRIRVRSRNIQPTWRKAGFKSVLYSRACLRIFIYGRTRKQFNQNLQLHLW